MGRLSKLYLTGVFLFISAGALSAAPNPAPVISPYVFDTKLFLEGVNLLTTPTQRARCAAACFRLECSKPSEGEWSEGVTRHYSVLEWMLMYLEHTSMRDGVDRPTLRAEMLATPMVEAREVLMLARGLLADPEVTQEVGAYLGDISKPAYLRAAAARALGYLRNPRSLPQLASTLEGDQAWEVQSKISWENSDPTKGNWKFYPVRWAALRALQEFERSQLLPNPMKVILEKAVVHEDFTDEEWLNVERRRMEKALRESDYPGSR